MTVRVLHDGWPLVHAPLSAAALHLRTLLALAPEEVEPLLALPVASVAEIQASRVKIINQATIKHSAWEQRVLPRLAEENGAAWIHTTQLGASLFGKISSLVSPTEILGSSNTVSSSRFSRALGRGGLARASILWPDDLSPPKLPSSIQLVPPVTHHDFKHGHAALPTELNLPEEFVLVHGLTDRQQLLRLLESWTWAAASMGEYYPLLILGLDEETNSFVEARLPEFHIQDSVRLSPRLDAQYLPAIYQACAALVHLGQPAPWGSSLRHALACGKAVVAHQEPQTETIVGSAAYLIAPDDLRAFGAAMITVVVDETAREKLEHAAWQRASHWEAAKFQPELLKLYQEKS